MSLWQPGYLPAMTLAGKVFTGCTTKDGVTLPAYNATAQKFGLFNPYGSGKYLVPIKLNVGQTDDSTPAVASLVLSYLDGLTAGAATGTGLTALTATAATSGIIGKSYNHAGVFTLDATISAPAMFYVLGFSQDTVTPASGLVTMSHDFDGTLAVPPGCYIGLGGADGAPGQDFAASITWLEVDIA
jgi:hypothetical protein